MPLATRLPFAALLGLSALASPEVSAQFNTPSINCDIGADEYGTGNANTYVSGGATWYMTWDDTYLYLSIQNANETEAGIVYLDLDPILPVNGGGTGNGNTTGLPGYDGLTPDLPFRADAAIYFKNDYRELRRRGGAGSWTTVNAGNNGLGGGSDDYADGHYCSHTRGNGPNGDDDRELRISWSRLTGGGSRPAAFNWNGYLAYANGIYGQVPVENPSGTLGSGATPDFVRYFTVSNTGNGVSTNPFSRNSYTHIGGNVAGFGAIAVYDFTMNTAGFTITRNTTTGGDWTIAHDLVVADGTVHFGASGGASYGATTVGNLKLAGDASFTLAANGTLEMGYTNQPLVVLDSLLTFDIGDGTSGCGGSDFREPNVFLSNDPGGDIEVEGELAAYDESSVTTRTGGGELVLTSEPGRLATIAPPPVIGGLCAGGSGVTNGDIVYERYYNGTQGWRLIGSPLQNQPFTTLNDDFHTQGAVGADFEHGGDILFGFDADAPSTDPGETDRFVSVEDYHATMGQGTGYAFYAYVGAPGGTVPARWDVKGQERTADLALTLDGYGDSTSTAVVSRYNLLANPYAGYLDWNAVYASSQRIKATYQVWDPDCNAPNGCYRTFTAGVDSHPTGAGRYIAPAQGFFVQAFEAGPGPLRPVVEFRQNQKVNGATPNIFGREGGELLPHLRLALAGEGLEAPDVTVAFTPEGSTGEDAYDATRLGPLGGETLGLWMRRGTEPLVVQGLPETFETSQRLPLRLAATRPGTYTVTWPALHTLPDDWTLLLRDLETGEVTNLREAATYTFTTAAVTNVGRFELEITPGVVTAEEPTLPPAAFALSPVAPNPLREAAQVTLRVGSSQRVTADLYDVLGRRVATLFEGMIAGGATRVLTLDGSTLSAGVYVLRVEGERFQTARAVTVSR
ncbi:MAG TPA: T9SS type A sorting domain-containing protein [Rubricoccaceae bacterium]|nr:T9SS type A sorting domain-containing protein [Rubricoccaceae bacterium]